jgi:hypothetical protein
MEHSSRYNLPDSAEFVANRQGAMTQAQRISIGVRLAVDSCLALGIGLAGLIVGRIVWLWRQAAPWQISATIIVLAALLLLAILVWCLARLLSGWLDLSAGQVEQAEGRIIWMGRNYGALIKGRRLRLISGRNIPPPGNYRFFYLPRSGWLLSIEKLTLSTGVQANSDLLHALAHANDFNVESLKANRAGRLTNDQAWQLLTPMLVSLLVGLLVIGAAVAVICIILIRGDLRSMGMIIPIAFAVAVLVVIYLWKDMTTIIPDILEGRVAVVEGTAYKRVVSTSGRMRRRTDHFYEINDRRFKVSRQGYDALFAGLPYRLYYVPNSSIMVSIEPSAPPVDVTEPPEP